MFKKYKFIHARICKYTQNTYKHLAKVTLHLNQNEHTNTYVYTYRIYLYTQNIYMCIPPMQLYILKKMFICTHTQIYLKNIPRTNEKKVHSKRHELVDCTLFSIAR